MIGLVIAGVGWVCLVASLVVVFGPLALAGAGAVMVPVGLLVDWERSVNRGERR